MINLLYGERQREERGRAAYDAARKRPLMSASNREWEQLDPARRADWLALTDEIAVVVVHQLVPAGAIELIRNRGT